MSTPADKLAERYALRLTPHWRAWFDRESIRQILPGAMRMSLSADELCAVKVSAVRAGFMPPDTLPLVGNEYGDWLCVRVLPDGGLGEVLYWYHGGGDWIPVGNCMAEAVLHDAVDHFRSQRRQVLRGAAETLPAASLQVLERMTLPALLEWQANELPVATGDDTPSRLQAIIHMLQQGGYVSAIAEMHHCGWAPAAVTCDLIELYLQAPVQVIADSTMADALGVAWYPDYVHMMFDTGQLDPALRSQLHERLPPGQRWPVQDWEAASGLAESMIELRQDMGWAFAISGWARYRQGDLDGAIARYWQGRHASAFSDQAVRLNSHSRTEQTGKFGMDQLLGLQEQLPEQIEHDQYWQVFTSSARSSVLTRAHDYWWRAAEQHAEGGDHAAAYRCYFRAGWDMGISRLDGYVPILERLARSAHQAGWPARALVAELHLRCLS